MPLIQHKDFTPVCDECGKAGSVISVSTGEDAIPLPDGWTARKEIDWNRYVFFNEDRVPVKTVIACDECNQPQRDTEG